MPTVCRETSASNQGNLLPKTETGHQQACEREEFEDISELEGGEEEFYHLNQSKACGALELGKSLWNSKASFINQCHNFFWSQLSKMNKFPHFSFQGKFFFIIMQPLQSNPYTQDLLLFAIPITQTSVNRHRSGNWSHYHVSKFLFTDKMNTKLF